MPKRRMATSDWLHDAHANQLEKSKGQLYGDVYKDVQFLDCAILQTLYNDTLCLWLSLDQLVPL